MAATLLLAAAILFYATLTRLLPCHADAIDATLRHAAMLLFMPC